MLEAQKVGIVAIASLVYGWGTVGVMDEGKAMTIFERCKGRRVDVDYETGYHFVIEYLSETELRWHALSKTAEGAPDHEGEPYPSYSLGDDAYMVNWIEESGLVVSRVADFRNGRVTAFKTWPDKDARGGRAELLHKGTLTLLEG